MLEKIGGLMLDIGRIVRASHERWDGKGYPDGLSAEGIPLESRIIAGCDAFNAMTTTRSYRTAMGLTRACEELARCAGSQFDPAVVAVLLELVAPVKLLETVAAPSPQEPQPEPAEVWVPETMVGVAQPL